MSDEKGKTGKLTPVEKRELNERILKLNSDQQRFVAKIDLFKYAIRYMFYTLCALGFFWSLHDLFRAIPDSLARIADILRELNVAKVIWIVAGLLGYAIAWIKDRRIKRLVAQNGDLRRMKEDRDPYKTRSGLDRYGNSQGDE
ncbi:MAG: hypothetical protein IJR99_03130 [Kiritimatiellae bacterium]|nr:hypothetical protein [Kiritimatiellia bacterium]